MSQHAVDADQPPVATLWGPGGDFAWAPISDGRSSWQAVLPHREGEAFEDDLAEAQRRFGRWPSPVPELLAGTLPAAVFRHDLYEVVGDMPSYVAGRLVLLGDAAHAMLPTLSQGANQALEDAVVLGESLAPDVDLARGLANYDAIRRPRAVEVAQWSRIVAQNSAGGNPRPCGWLRRTLAKRRLAGLARWHG